MVFPPLDFYGSRILSYTMAATFKRLFGSSGSETNLAEVKEKNAQIGDQVIVDGVQVFQDANGAPVETVSPLGYHVGWAGILFLNVSQMVGTGVFSTRKSSSHGCITIKLIIVVQPVRFSVLWILLVSVSSTGS